MKLSLEALGLRLDSGLHSTAILILPLLILFNAGFNFTAEFSPLRSKLFDPEAEPPALIKLGELQEKLPPTGKQNERQDLVMIFSSSLMMTPALFADRSSLGLPGGDLNEAYRHYLDFRSLANLLPNCSVVNLAAPALMISENTLLLQAVLKRGYKPGIAVLAIAPRDFIDNTVAPFQESSTAQLLVEELAQGQTYNFDSSLSLKARIYIAAQKYWPLFRMKSRIKQLFHALIKDNSTTGMPSRLGENRLDEGQLRWDLENYKRRYLPVDWNRWSKERACLKEFKQICLQRNIPLLIVAMPLTRRNYGLLPWQFRELYRQELKALANLPGRVKLVDLTQDENFSPEEDYTDSSHLRASGGLKLARILSRTLKPMVEEQSR